MYLYGKLVQNREGTNIFCVIISVEVFQNKSKHFRNLKKKFLE